MKALGNPTPPQLLLTRIFQRLLSANQAATQPPPPSILPLTAPGVAAVPQLGPTPHHRYYHHQHMPGSQHHGNDRGRGGGAEAEGAAGATGAEGLRGAGMGGGGGAARPAAGKPLLGARASSSSSAASAPASALAPASASISASSSSLAVAGLEGSGPDETPKTPRRSLTPQPPPNAFRYTPFEGHGAIRVLTLEPGSGDDELVGHLAVEQLSDKPRYEAISYVWGTDGRQAAMTCNGRPLQLTRSVQQALQRMRHASEPRRLWADQVCINQDDIAERSQQVRLMNEIYRGAERVLVWLGPDAEGLSHEAVRMVHHLHDIFSDDEKHDAFRLKHSEELMLQSKDPWVPLAKLTRQPWFNRIWIVQEIGTAAPAILYWGAAEVNWEVLSLVAAELNQNYHYLRSRFRLLTPSIRYLYRRFVHPEEDGGLRRAVQYRRTIVSRASWSSSKTDLASEGGDEDSEAGDQRHDEGGDDDDEQLHGNFIYELHRARHLLAKDPRDHVYAFLGHFSIHEGNPSLKQLSPDYSRSIEEVYYDVAARELVDADSLLLLSASHGVPATYRPYSRNRQRGPGKSARASAAERDPPPAFPLPSWVPDWRTVPMHLLGPPWTPHRAAGDSRPQLRIDHETRALHIVGRRVDRIGSRYWTFYGRAFQFRQANAARQLPIESVWHHICAQRRFSLAPRYRTGEPAFFAMVQTLTNGCVALDRRRDYASTPPEEWLRHGAAYLVRAEGGSDVVDPELRALAAEGDAFAWSHQATLVTRYRNFAVTQGGFYMVGPDVVSPGDHVVVLKGGRTPFVMRQRVDGAWTLLGDCYVHGLMNGETESMEGLEDEEFRIV